MRLLSLTVRNYRIHRDITVEFDRSRNLIGGTNETGKSTLAEAIHRALFMRHRSGGAIQEAMKSDIHNGHPEVKLTFESGGRTWTLDKRFSGNSGSARLAADDGTTFQGDAAEDQLGKLVGNPDGASTTVKQLANQWSHLWVWQGTAGDNATTHTASRKDELVQRLQEQGLAAVMQSDTDERVRETIRQNYDAMFTATGAVKANSKLDAATKELALANAMLTRASDQKLRLEKAIMDQDEASRLIAEADAALPGLRETLKEVSASREKVKDLQGREESEKGRAEAATHKRDQIAKADKQIRELNSQSATARLALAPAEERLTLLTRQEATAREAAEKATGDHRSVAAAVRIARQRHDLALACVTRFEKVAVRDILQIKVAEVSDLEGTLSTQREALSALPPVDAAKLDTLRKLDAEVGQAEAALAAIAAGIELVYSEQTVLLDGSDLQEGQSRIITETAELLIGPSTRLRIRPGGGISLTEAHRKAAALRQNLSNLLDELTVRDLTAASDALARRKDIEERIRGVEKELKKLDAKGLPAALAAATDDLNAAIAEIERRRTALSDIAESDLPSTLEDARTWTAENSSHLRDLETSEASLLADVDALSDKFQGSAQTLKSHREAIDADRNRIRDFEAQARVLEENHGDETTRRQALAEAVTAEDAAKASLHAITMALSALNPKGLEDDRSRLIRVIDRQEANRNEAGIRRAGAQAILGLDGSSDPEAELLQAKARHAAAADEHSREKRHADAIQLLHRLFSESQTAISESVTQPIADRVDGYLECLFGPGVRVQVDLSDPNKTSLNLTRPGTPSFAFDTLSGGAKEQVAAAVRLATAEILAASHDHCLPVLFDDAFAYADPVRVQALQRMLDLAANRGLQVVVLSCTPADYIGLGAGEIRLTTQLGMANSPLSDASNESAAQENTRTELPVSNLPSGDTESAFLDALRIQGGSSGNQSLRATLGWDEATYDQVKTSLIARNHITPGKGRGGSVSLA